MPTTIDELFTSQRGGAGAAGNMELMYVVRGTSTLTDVESTVDATAPATWDSKYKGPSYDVEYVGPEMWIVRVPYGPDTSSQRTSSSPTEYSFEIGAETQHTQVSISTAGSYGTDPPSYKQLVNCETKDGKVTVKGADIFVPKYEFGQSKIYSNSYLDTAKKLSWANLVAKVNDEAFQGMDALTVMYMGCSGQKRGRGDWEVRHRFVYSPNRTDVVIGDITASYVSGWDYVWVVYEEQEDDTAHVLIAVPKFVYVEQMYEPSSFSVLGL